MKAHQEEQFIPITLTRETQEEFNALYSISARNLTIAETLKNCHEAPKNLPYVEILGELFDILGNYK